MTRVNVTGRILRGHGIWTQLKEKVELARGEPGELQIGKGERETASSKVLKGSGSREEPGAPAVWGGGAGLESISAHWSGLR